MQTPEFKEKRKATQFQPGVSGNPAGKPKGVKHINTWVQEILEDPNFEAWITDPKEGVKLFQGAPIKAIIKAQVIKAVHGDTKAYDSLHKSGYSQKIEQDITSGGEKIDFNATQAEQLIRARAERTNT